MDSTQNAVGPEYQAAGMKGNNQSGWKEERERSKQSEDDRNGRWTKKTEHKDNECSQSKTPNKWNRK